MCQTIGGASTVKGLAIVLKHAEEGKHVQCIVGQLPTPQSHVNTPFAASTAVGCMPLILVVQSGSTRGKS